MRKLYNGLIYDTDLMELMFNLTENTPNREQFDNKSTTFGSNLLTYGTSEARWITVNCNIVPESDPNFKYENYIAKTKNDNFVIVSVKLVLTEKNNWSPIGRNIIRFFKDKIEIREFLTENHGYDDKIDREIERFFDKIGIELKNA